MTALPQQSISLKGAAGEAGEAACLLWVEAEEDAEVEEPHLHLLDRN